ncbi:conserved hypothetical protein [Verticillium alfalfae VaMs.102]|uniref:Uncharacterized protein n=1 Tax=Verticillium alfalfae (strain VaMs.102 / ATCC MYA-4576 / FGSC 10136) TaxID=526221 RepID=C9SI05_VERA1|nr:conserved hypothetical protein [Verticillium alfalfae VaMs.102]EEY18578.1 conserved hypothetical protein [Verticillium alfalfae VaMs.102]
MRFVGPIFSVLLLTISASASTSANPEPEADRLPLTERAAVAGAAPVPAPGTSLFQRAIPELLITRLGAFIAEDGLDSNGQAPALEKRACKYNGCKCNSRGKQFRSCGNCVWTDNGAWVIKKKRVKNHIYECAPDGGCCDYGPAKDCGKSTARCYVKG